MSRLQFLILTSLSSLIALSVVLQIVFVRLTEAEGLRLKQTEASLEEGQLYLNRTQQIAGRIAQVAQAQNDQQLKDLLARQNFQIRNPGASTPAAAPASTPPATR